MVDNIDEWVLQWLNQMSDDDVAKVRDLNLDKYAFKCGECGNKFIKGVPKNRYLSSYKLVCPKCGNFKENAKFEHFYIN